jgi:uncharacterized RDD family membrane protein YckC
MTNQPPPGGPNQPPPPPEGMSYPPPPPSAGGFAPPPPGPVVRAQPTESYTPWLTRVLAYLIDSIPVAVVYGIAFVIAMVSTTQKCVSSPNPSVPDFCYTEQSALASIGYGLAGLLIFAYALWNFGYRQGTTGSSIGKSIMKFKVVSEATGQPLGFVMSFVRQLAHIADSFCGIGYLFPLWDAKRQTFADKIMTTVCLPI